MKKVLRVVRLCATTNEILRGYEGQAFTFEQAKDAVRLVRMETTEPFVFTGNIDQYVDCDDKCFYVIQTPGVGITSFSVENIGEIEVSNNSYVAKFTRFDGKVISGEVDMIHEYVVSCVPNMDVVAIKELNKYMEKQKQKITKRAEEMNSVQGFGSLEEALASISRVMPKPVVNEPAKEEQHKPAVTKEMLASIGKAIAEQLGLELVGCGVIPVTE